MAASETQPRLRRNIWPLALLYLLFWVFCLWMASQIPYTHDDWGWGLPIGIQQLLTANINSRYAGNLLVVVLTRSPFLKTFVMGSTLLLLPVVCVRVATGAWINEDKPGITACIFLFCALALLITRKFEWAETFGWVSGFCNYVFSALMLELFLFFSSSVFEGRRAAKCGFAEKIGLFLFCVLMQLFLENLTVYLFCASFVFFVVDWLQNRRPSIRFGIMLLGAFVGTIFMFSSKIYGSLLFSSKAVEAGRTMTFYLDYGLKMIIDILYNQYISIIAPGLWEKNYINGLFLSLLLFVILVIKRKNIKPFLFYLLSLLHLFSLVMWILLWCGWYPEYKIDHLSEFHSIVNIGYFLLIFIELVVFYHNDKFKLFKLLGLWVSAWLVLAPLAAVYLDGFRMFITSDILIILLSSSFFFEIIRLLPLQACRIIASILCLAVIGMCAKWGVIYTSIASDNRSRLEVISTAIDSGTDSIELPGFKYSDYVHFPTPGSDSFLDCFKEFYGIPTDTAIAFTN